MWKLTEIKASTLLSIFSNHTLIQLESAWILVGLIERKSGRIRGIIRSKYFSFPQSGSCTVCDCVRSVLRILFPLSWYGSHTITNCARPVLRILFSLSWSDSLKLLNCKHWSTVNGNNVWRGIMHVKVESMANKKHFEDSGKDQLLALSPFWIFLL